MMYNWTYGEMAKHTEFVDTCETIRQNLNELHKVLEELLPLKECYDKMTLESKIEYDLFLLYTINSLFWVNLRVQGIDPNSHPIKDELERVKAAMKRWQENKDKKLRPKVDLDAAKRFVRSGLFDPSTIQEPANKKIRFNED